MTSAATSSNEAPEPGTVPASPSTEIEIRLLSAASDMVIVDQMFQQVWGSSTDVVPLELLMAISHSGGYVVGAFDMSRGEGGEILGASVALLARHQDGPALHSHVTGILAGARSHGLGRMMKLHQQRWAAERSIDWIVWTFDPLVRRNAWFNIAILGAEVHEYLPDFYGVMSDAINAGDESDRLLMAWSTEQEVDGTVRDGSEVEVHQLFPTPDDIVALRRTDSASVARWRTEMRTALTTVLDDGYSIVGFTRSGEYVIGR